MDKIFDTIIIGSGPAGYAAGIYASRAQLDTLMLEDPLGAGGQLVNTYEVANYPGITEIDGYTLSQKFREHAIGLGLEIRGEKVKALDLLPEIKEIKTRKNTYYTRTVVLATGATHATLSVPGEEALRGVGVSYCATCDGAFFKDKVCVVVGGGDVAVEDAIFLSRVCRQVYLVHRRDELRATRVLQTELFEKENVSLIWNSVVTEINGSERVSSVTLQDVKTRESRVLETDGVFIAVGIHPYIELVQEQLELEQGYVKADETCETSVPGVFAAGDVRRKQLRQIVTAAADGANAITSIERYLTARKQGADGIRFV